MTTKSENMFSRLSLNQRSIFFVDSMGALSSALLLVFLIVPFETIFGMPQHVAYFLSIPAFVFAAYSLGCHLLKVKRWIHFLRGIMIANCLYCLITLWLIVDDYDSFTVLGIAYFLGEIGIILFLVRIEWMLIKKNSR